MNRTIKFSILLALIALIGSVLVAACSQAAPQPAAAATQLPALPTAAALLPTAAPTAAPTETSIPATATAAPTLAPTNTTAPTAVPTLGLTQDSLAAWCLPANTSSDQVALASSDPLNPPADAQVGQMVNGAFEVRNLPASGCVFTYTFNQTAPSGLKLEIYDQSNSGPWLIADLQPVDGKPETVEVLLRHSMIIAPPWWDVNYRFSLVDANGTELRQDVVGMHRWTVEYCWNGRKPNVNTLRCPLQQDLHPWDPSYRTPFPTPKPKDD